MAVIQGNTVYEKSKLTNKQREAYKRIADEKNNRIAKKWSTK